MASGGGAGSGWVYFSIWLSWRRVWGGFWPLEELFDTFWDVFFTEVTKILFYFLFSESSDESWDNPGLFYPLEFPGVAKDGLRGILTWWVNLPPSVNFEAFTVGKARWDVYLVNDYFSLWPAFSDVLASFRIRIFLKGIRWHCSPEFLHSRLQVRETLESRLLRVEMPVSGKVNSVTQLLLRDIEAVESFICEEGKPHFFNTHREEVLFSSLFVLRQEGYLINDGEEQFFIDPFILGDGSQQPRSSCLSTMLFENLIV